jgi:hypothetical protein
VGAVMQLSLASAPAAVKGSRATRRLTPPLTAVVAPAEMVLKQSLARLLSLINHWLKHEIPDSSRWKNPPVTWQAAKAQLAIQFEDRFVLGD